MHDLFIAKLQAYGFDNGSLNFICNYLVGRERRIKLNSSFSTWSNLENGLPQGSILGSLLFNINTLDMFFEQKDVRFAAYADDYIPHFCNKTLKYFSVSIRYVHQRYLNGFQIIMWKWILTSVTLFLVLMMKIRK